MKMEKDLWNYIKVEEKLRSFWENGLKLRNDATQAEKLCKIFTKLIFPERFFKIDFIKFSTEKLRKGIFLMFKVTKAKESF